jgi:hypothetical protein
MSDKMNEDSSKTFDKTVVVKNDIFKKNIASNKLQKVGKKDGRIFNDKYVQTETIKKIEISSGDLMLEGIKHFFL